MTKLGVPTTFRGALLHSVGVHDAADLTADLADTRAGPVPSDRKHRCGRTADLEKRRNRGLRVEGSEL
jgi:hypothetical protein